MEKTSPSNIRNVVGDGLGNEAGGVRPPQAARTESVSPNALLLSDLQSEMLSTQDISTYLDQAIARAETRSNEFWDSLVLFSTSFSNAGTNRRLNECQSQPSAETRRKQAAVLTLQCWWRSILARRIFAIRFRDKLTKEEALQLNKQKLQVEAGLVLIERVQVQREIEDNMFLERVRRNDIHRAALTIQRALKEMGSRRRTTAA